MSSSQTEGSGSRTPIAITGLGCWYPGAQTPLELWENVLSRRLEFRSIPDCRLPLADYCDPSGEDIDKLYAKRVAMMDGFEFDWVGHRIPKSMFESTDIVHWLSLEIASKALEDAGYTKDTLDK
ncbi:MAG: beta-ketoacyl synthase N-terminal-like domain-containing protein, partial [Planctomycetaceae bacterium]